MEGKRIRGELALNALLEWRDGPYGDYRVRTTKEEKEAAGKVEPS